MSYIRPFLKTCDIHISSCISKRKSSFVLNNIMAYDICKKHLQNISKHLNEFEHMPKEVEGNKICQWFKEGENIFQEFYMLGTCVKWNMVDIKKNQSEVHDLVCRITKNKGWLQSFITIYPGLRIDLEGCTPAVDICRVRSGIELLLRGFSGIDQTFDKVLTDLQELGELEEFDEHLKIWTEGHRPNFFPEDRNAETPQSHWWWI